MAALLFCVSAVMADVSSLSRGYLPPDQGYNYNQPSVPFPPAPPSYRPPGPPPSYRPPGPSTLRPPVYPSSTSKPIYTTPKPYPGAGSGFAEEGSQISPVSNPGAGLGGGEVSASIFFYLILFQQYHRYFLFCKN